MSRGALAVLASLFVAAPLSAQAGVAERVRDRVSPAVAAALEQIATDAASRGLPTEPLVQKALEGAAKRVPDARVIGALRALADRLDAAAAALRAADVAALPAPAIEAAAFALGAGLGSSEIAALARSARPPHGVDQTLRVGGALAVLGVPATDVVTVIVAAIEAGQSAADVARLPAQVQVRVAGGMRPADAVRGPGPGPGAGPPGRVPPGPPITPPQGPPPGKPNAPTPRGNPWIADPLPPAIP